MAVIVAVSSLAIAFASLNQILTFNKTEKIMAAASKVSTIKLNKTKLTLVKGNSETLKVTISSSNVNNETVEWKSSNTNVVTVDKNGKITAKTIGTAIITAKTKDGKKADCKVTIRMNGGYIEKNETWSKPNSKPMISFDSLGNKNRVMQAWMKFKDYYYVTQRDAYVTKVSLDGKTKTCLNFKTFGHLANIDFETTNGTDYMWVACGGVFQSGNSYTAKSICRIKLNSLKWSYSKGNSNDYGCAVNNLKDITYNKWTIVNAAGNAVAGEVAIDTSSEGANPRTIVIRTGSRIKSTYYVYDLDTFLRLKEGKITTENLTKNASFKWTLDHEKLNNAREGEVKFNGAGATQISWQGFVVFKNYIYILEGNPSDCDTKYKGTYCGGDSTSRPTGVYLSAYTLSGQKMFYRKKIAYPNSKYAIEPEGIKVINGNIYVGFIEIDRLTTKPVSSKVYKIPRN